MQDVEKYLGEYLTLEPEQREGDCTFEETRKERDNLSVSDYAGILDERGVNIVDECQDDKSRLMVVMLSFAIISIRVFDHYKLKTTMLQIYNKNKKCEKNCRKGRNFVIDRWLKRGIL